MDFPFSSLFQYFIITCSRKHHNTGVRKFHLLFCLQNHTLKIRGFRTNMLIGNPNLFFLSFYVSECHLGNYGMNCTSTCGHCLRISDCSRFDGTCHSGCSAGYYKKSCQQGGVHFSLCPFFYLS